MNYSEQDLLNPEVRKKLIEEFNSTYNSCRKYEAFKAYECLKDKTINYVLDLILKQFDEATVWEMQYSLSNISILRKVIEKLAKVYSNGVKRTVVDGEGNPIDEATLQVEEAADYLNIDEAMKKCNRYYRTFKNTLVGILPVELDNGLFNLKPKVLPPFHYDVVPDAKDPTVALAIIQSDYYPHRPTLYTLGDAAYAGRGVDSGIRKAYNWPVAQANSYSQETDKREYIWWTKNFHFTTNCKGERIDSGTGENPILELPFVNFHGDQDDSFWAEGGEDLIDAGVKINTHISNMNHIGVSQGHGQLYMTGANLPKSVKVGPNHCLQLEVNEGDPQPTIGYLNANPQVAELRSNIEMEVALMLSTNNLSTSGFSVSLQGSGKDFASGIALMIDKSESVEDIGDQAKVFVENEPEIWQIFSLWLDVYRSAGLLSEEASQIILPDNLDKLQIQFPSPKPIMSEKEQLEVIQIRKDMGLNTMVELIMRDDPSLDTQAAMAKIKAIEEEKRARMESFAINGGVNGDQGQSGNGQLQQDGQPNQPNGGAGNTGQDQSQNQG